MMMDEEFNSVSMEIETGAYFRSFRINKLISNNQASADPLEKMLDEITKRTSQDPKHFEDVERTIHYLPNRRIWPQSGKMRVEGQPHVRLVITSF